MKDISKHIKDTAKMATVEETSKVQATEAQRLGEMLCGMFSAKQFSEVVETTRQPEKMADVLLQGLKACGLLLENEGTVGTLHMNVELDMYPAPRNLDEELDRLAEKYGTEYLAEHLLDHPSDLASIQMAMDELKVAAPLEDQITGDTTLPEACVVDVLQRYLLAGEYFSPEIGASPTLELAIADAVAYVRELMDLRKALAASEDDGK